MKIRLVKVGTPHRSKLSTPDRPSTLNLFYATSTMNLSNCLISASAMWRRQFEYSKTIHHSLTFDTSYLTTENPVLALRALPSERNGCRLLIDPNKG